MLDFKELSKDGTDLERLAREIFVREGYETHWTGKGTDGGRDLIIKEKVSGPLSKFERTWLVQCKHKAHSGDSVGKAEANSLITDCKRVGATGYLMICTTSLTSGLIQAYTELEEREDIVIKYWDEVRIEDRLFKPCNFSLINQFFPQSSNNVGLKIYNTNSPSFWAANYKDAFFYLSSRLAMHFTTTTYIKHIYELIESVKKEHKLDQINIDAQLRCIYFDDKHGTYTVFVDVILDQDALSNNPFGLVTDLEQKFAESIFGKHVGVSDGEGYLSVDWDVKVHLEKTNSDRYTPHAKKFYTPYMEHFKGGFSRRY
ncbi:restriction endonuclease [Bacillus wiedmannii]|uniref:restriction endonuclease n=1 Tax=Bacillus wiedmannii TaxID=1890302 RepID=UPI0034D527FD